MISTALASILTLAVMAGCGNAKTSDSSAAETTAAPATTSESSASSSGTSASSSGTASETTKKTAQSEAHDNLGEVVADRDYNIGFSIYMRDQFLSAVESAFAAECENLGIHQVTADANGNANDQLNQVATFASQKVDVIVVNLVNTDNTQNILEAAGDIPVVFVNRQPEGDLVPGKHTFVGSDEFVAGRMQGEFLAAYFKNSGKDPIKYVMMQGTLGLQNTQARTKAAEDALKASGLNFECVYQDTAEWDRAKAQNKMQTFLGTSTEFDAVICNADEMALGTIEALKSAGVDLSKVPVVGIDGLIGGATAVKNGEMAFTVHQDAIGQGAGAARAAVLFANGRKDIPVFVEVPFTPVTPETVDQYLE